ncbi:unnamed protein product [Symbiodinium sp. CCMP2592]|nr:unnamed protein product [Symbiodinium sp. CCMP2592]
MWLKGLLPVMLIFTFLFMAAQWFGLRGQACNEDLEIASRRTAPDFEWCKPSKVVPYTGSAELPAFRIRLGIGSGACSTLLSVFEAAMYAMQQQRRFFLDENVTRLKGNRTTWYRHFFQPIGEAFTQPFVDIAYTKDVTRLTRNGTITFRNQTMRKIDMKRSILRQVWQFQPSVQQDVCHLVHGLHLHHPYIAMFIRLGDKLTVEHRVPVPLEDYIDTLLGVSLNGLVRTVFVAMDDCRVLQKLQAAAPMFKFLSLCDVEFGTGFIMDKDSKRDLEAHFLKFFGELTVMAEADTLIGDRQSNVHHWVALMRRISSSNVSLIDVRQHPYMTAEVP